MTSNRYHIQELASALDSFASGKLSLSEVQSILSSRAPLFERGLDDLSSTVLLAEADLEEIQFARLADQQRTAALLRLEELRDVLRQRLHGP